MGLRGRNLGFSVAVGLLLGLSACGEKSVSHWASVQGTTAAARATSSVASPIRANTLGQQELTGVRRMIDGLMEGVNSRDSSICTRYYTRRYRESLMQAKDPGALTRCRKAARTATIQASLVGIERLNIRRSSSGDLIGNVQFVQRIGTGVLLRSRFGLVRTTDGYRIASGHGEQITPSAPPASTG
jgi:hypothetical protein